MTARAPETSGSTPTMYTLLCWNCHLAKQCWILNHPGTFHYFSKQPRNILGKFCDRRKEDTQDIKTHNVMGQAVWLEKQFCKGFYPWRNCIPPQGHSWQGPQTQEQIHHPPHPQCLPSHCLEWMRILKRNLKSVQVWLLTVFLSIS